MKFFSKIILVLTIVFASNSFAVDKKENDYIFPIIGAFKSQNKNTISTLISYPLKRKLPIPFIKNKTELINRFDEVFDKELIDLISNSDVNKDWRQMGWRGTMFSNGKLWLDSNGKINAINYHTAKEKAFEQSLIEKQKQTLHSSISDYKKPILEWKTAKFHIRIDDLGDYNYRYTSWSINKKTNVKPDLVLFNGKMAFDGSGGNHHYSFTNGKYTYRCYVSLLGNSKSAPGTLDVFRGKEHLLSDDVLEVIGQ
jgi:hypothetical protein